VAGGVWMAGKGISSDGVNIYASTGAGEFNLTNGDHGMSFIKFDGNLNLVDYFVPANFQAFTNAAQDAGNAGIVVLPGVTNLLWAGGTKYMKGHMINAANMGKFNPVADSCLQTISIPSTSPVGQQPVAWNGGPLNIYLWPIGSEILQFHYTAQGVISLFANNNLTAGGSVAVTSTGTTNGIVWVIGNDGIVRALSAVNISQVFWTSTQNAARDALPAIPAKFQFPTIVNGKAYISTSAAQIVTYGLLVNAPTQLMFTTQPQALVITGFSIGTFTVAVVTANNVVVPSTFSITISIALQETQPIFGTLTEECVNGLATFTNITISASGQYNLLASAGSLLTGLSQTIVVLETPPNGVPSQTGSVIVAAVSSPTTVNTVLVGATVGSVIGVIFLIALILLLLRIRRNRANDYWSSEMNGIPTQNNNGPVVVMSLNDIQDQRMNTIRDE